MNTSKHANTQKSFKSAGKITATLPDGATYTFWGFVQGSEPSEMVEGSQPTQTITIHPSNQDNNKVEQAPTFVASSL